jgi:TorA maturation chaperone TorD
MSETAPPNTLHLLAKADLFLLLAEVCSPRADQGPPPAALLGRVPELFDYAAVNESVKLDPALRATLEQAADTPPGEWAAESTRLFQAGIACPCNETAYIRRDKGAVIGDICGFYAAFGLTPRNDSTEKPDHISHELEFVAALLVMLARAIDAGEDEAAAVTRDALISFAEDHPGQWIPAFTQRLTSATGLVVFAGLAAALELAWGLLLADFGLEITGPAEDDHQPDEGSPYECGMAEQDQITALTAGGRELA